MSRILGRHLRPPYLRASVATPSPTANLDDRPPDDQASAFRAGERPEGYRGRSALIDAFPPFRTIPAYWTSINHGGGTYGTNNSAWYGLQRVRVPDDSAQELALVGLKIDLLPTNPDGAGSSLAWGDSTGTSAAIVVGQNLPITLGAFTEAPVAVPGIETSGQSLLTGSRFSSYLHWEHFPAGKYNDVTPLQLRLSRAWLPCVARIQEGTSLDVAVVFRGTQLSGQIGSLVGFVSVQLAVALVEHLNIFSA